MRVGLPFDSSCRVGLSFRFVVPACDHGAFPRLVHYDLAIELPTVGPGASRRGVVPVAKRDTKEVRLCDYYKVTINPVMREDKFPLPRAEDIFANMAGGKRFSKIDL